VNDFACKVLGIDSLSPETLALDTLLKDETIPVEPILFITTPGADPSSEIRELALKHVGSDGFSEVHNLRNF
jgi:dynein heavy chain 2